MRLVALGPVFVNRRGRIPDRAARMRCDTHAAVENLHRCGRTARIQLLADELVGDAVIVMVDLDVIVDVCFDRLPNCHDVAAAGQWFERRSVQLLEQSDSAGIGTLTEGPAVEPVQEFANGIVEVPELEELPMT